MCSRFQWLNVWLPLALLTFGVCPRLVLSAEPEIAKKGIEIARVKRSNPVDFDREILPIFKQSCLACHNRTNPKGELVLEGVKDVLKGGETGPAVVAKVPARSLLLQLAAHQKRPLMPPKDNKANAPNLTPEQLGLIQAWIEQGARPGSGIQAPIVMGAIPSSLKSIQALAVDPQGRYVAASKGGGILIHDWFLGEPPKPLRDPALKASAHQDLVQSLAVSPDGAWLASGSFREVKIWRRVQDEQARPVGRSPIGKPSMLSIHPSSNLVAVSDARGLVAIQTWGDSHTSKNLESVKAPVKAFAWAASGRQLAGLTASNEVVLWTPFDSTKALRLSLPRGILHAALAEDGSRIAGVTPEGLLKIWRITSHGLDEASSWKGVQSGLSRVLVSSGARDSVATISLEGELALWSGAKGEPEIRFKLPAVPQAIGIDWETERFAAACAKTGVLIGSLRSGKWDHQIESDPDARLALLDAERRKAFYTADLEVFKAAQAKTKKEADEEEARKKKAEEALPGLAKKIEESSKARDDSRAKLEESLKQLQEHRTRSGEAASWMTNLVSIGKIAVGTRIPEAELSAFSTRFLKEAAAEEKQVLERWSAASNVWFKADADAKKAVLDKSRGEEEVTLAGKALKNLHDAGEVAARATEMAQSRFSSATNQFEAAAASARNPLPAIHRIGFTAKGGMVLTAGVDGRIRRWRFADASMLPNLTLGTNGVASVSFASNGSWVGLGTNELIQLGGLPSVWKWDRTLTGHASSARKGQAPTIGITDRANVVRFSPDGRLLLAGAGEPSRSGELWVWDVPSFQSRAPFTKIHSDAILGIDFSPDGRWVATSASDRFARLLNVTNFQVVRTFEGHTHHVMGIAWKSDNRTVVSGGADNVVKVWDSTSGERRKNVEVFGKEVTAISYMPWAGQFLAASGDGQLILLKDSGETVKVLGKGLDFLYAAQISGDGRFAYAGGEDGVLRIWDLVSGKELGSFQ